MLVAPHATDVDRQPATLIHTVAALLPQARTTAARPADIGPTPLLRQVLDALGCGLVMVDAHGRVLHANAAATLQCRHGAPLVLPSASHGRGQPAEGLAAALSPKDAARLAAALAGAARGHWALLTLSHGDSALSVGVAPLQGDDEDWPDSAPVALLMLGAEASAQRLSRQFFDSAHQLTDGERGVLDGLCEGCSPQQIASLRKVKISTVRTQIAAIREKVGTSSIRRLLQRVSALPPMAGLGRLRSN
jgi:DNA-binding CsgD family transcriptional regulator